MNIRLKFLLVIFCCFISAEAFAKRQVQTDSGEWELLSEAVGLIQEKHPALFSDKELVYGALEGILCKLDKHSNFLLPEDLKLLKEDTRGKFGGIGVEIATREGFITVLSPLEGTPAWKAGLKPKDRILQIDKQDTQRFTLDQAVSLLRDEPGKKVTLKIYSPSENKQKVVDITREVIKVNDLSKFEMVSEGILFVRIADFKYNTAESLRKSVDELSKSQKLDGLILDLRHNPGGILESAVDVAGLFFPDKTNIVYTLDKSDKRADFLSRGSHPILKDIPVVVLADQGSGSGSEIVAGCFQDYKRALIVGKVTYGKASVQTIFPLSDGSAMKLTTAYYYTPKGRLIHDVGITPDILTEENFLPEKEIKTDADIEKAISVLKGIKFYKDKENVSTGN